MHLRRRNATKQDKTLNPEGFALHDRRLTDAGIMELQPLQQLRELSLQGNQAITDAGLEGLARLQSLEALDLQLCWQVSCLAPGLGVTVAIQDSGLSPSALKTTLLCHQDMYTPSPVAGMQGLLTDPNSHRRFSPPDDGGHVHGMVSTITYALSGMVLHVGRSQTRGWGR